MGKREVAVARALRVAPGSLRAVADEAGVSESLLRAIRDGERSATPVTVEVVAAALERLAQRHADAARLLRRVQQERGR